MNNKSSKGRGGNDESSEVDDLLRAAEDHLLLNLRVGSHSKSRNPFSPASSSSSSYFLDSALARRFDALKSPPNTNPNPPKSLNRSQEKKGIAADEESSGILGDDLAARFAALRAGSLGPPPNLGLERDPDRSRILKDSDDDDDDDKDGDGVSKKEVEKLMEWAKDAARLDPSSKSDDEEDAHGDDDEEDDIDDSEEERRKAKEKSRGKPKPKRLMHEAGYGLGNLDATLILQGPKLSLHKEAIRANLCDLLGADPSLVNLKAKTHEKVDSLEENRSIAAHTVVLLMRK